MANSQMIVTYEQGGREALNIGYVSGDWSNSSELDQVAQNIYDNWAANIMPSLSDDCVLRSVELRDLDDVFIGNSAAGSGTPGGEAGNAEAINSALVITKSDGASRRDGRWYIPGVGNSRVSAGGNVDAAWAGNLALQFQVCQVNLNPVFNSFYMNRHKVGVGGFLYANITSFGFLSTIGSQRGRRDN